MRLKNSFIVFLFLLLFIPIVSASWFEPTAPPPGPGPPGPQGPPGLPGNFTPGDGLILNISNVLYVNLTYFNDYYYPLLSNPAGFITIANVTGDFVLKTGDNMSGDLNMTNKSIYNVDVLQVHNITGMSPIFINSPVISENSITAGTFFGNIQGTNGTIFGMTITNGTISNMHVQDSALFNTSLVPEINNTWSLGNNTHLWKDFFVQNLVATNITSPSILTYYSDEVWINKNVTTFNFNQTKLLQFIVNNTQNQTIGVVIKQYTGANLTGSDGDINRLIDTGLTVSIVNVDTFTLQPTWDYTAVGTVVTFLNPIWNDQIITVYGNTAFASNNYLGAAFSGSDGSIGRTLNITAIKLIVVVDNFMLQTPVDFTIIGNVLTMNNELWDDQRVTIWTVI